MCQDPSVSPVGRTAVSAWLLTLRQQLGIYVFKPLPGRYWEMSFFACSFVLATGLCFLCQELFLCLLHFCGTCECKPHWLLEPGDLKTYSSGGCHKSCGIKYAVQAPSREILVFGFTGVGWREKAWSLGKITASLLMPARLEALPYSSIF